MTDTVFCLACGEPLASDSKFCEHCGAPQENREQARRPIVPKLLGDTPVIERVDALAPGAAGLASQIAAQLRTPTVALALAAGALGAALTFAISVLFALSLSDDSLLGLVDRDKGVITAGFAQMLNFLQVGYGDGVGKLGPALFLVFPIGACAIGAAMQARRTLRLPVRVRLLSGAGIGIPFGLLMLIPALAAGGLGDGGVAEPDVLAAVLLGALWGGVGGLLGTYYVVRTALEPGFLAGIAPAALRPIARTALIALRPLCLLLGLTIVAGTLTWGVESLFKANVREGRSTPVAVIDDAAYGVEHGVHWTELAGMAQFRLAGPDASPISAPVPLGDVSKLRPDSAGRYRLFGLSRAMPAYTFVPLLVFLLGSALLLAFVAGASVAEEHAPATPSAAAAWGCLVGPIWAIAMVLLNAIVAKNLFGRADGDSVFGTFLLGGLGVGGLGGLLNMQTQRKHVDQKVVADAPRPGARDAEVR